MEEKLKMSSSAQSESLLGEKDAEKSSLPQQAETFMKDQAISDDGDSLSADGYEESSTCCLFIGTVQSAVSQFYNLHKKLISKVLTVIGVLLYTAYFIWACITDYIRAIPLVIGTTLVAVVLLYRLAGTWFGDFFYKSLCVPVKAVIEPKWRIIKWCLIIGAVLLLAVLLAVIIGPRPNQYRGLGGILFFIGMLYITSHNPAKVNWRPVCWGISLNFLFAIIILKTDVGYNAFSLLGDQVTKFLSFTDDGAKFVFGKDTYTQHFFAFRVLPTIVFFSCIISLLYYLGVMQYVIEKIAFVMQLTMGTSATESLSCAGNIFVGQTEAPILIKPFLPEMSKSELHAVMTGGFATIAGGVLAAYISIGVKAVHLICASFMNAPMALAVSKLFYPEEDRSKRRRVKLEFTAPSEQNFIEAAANGASQSIVLVANIAANLIAFVSLLAFVNSAFGYFGGLVGYPEVTFQLLISYILYPVAFLMGVDSEDCLIVGELIGTKVFINELVAYESLSGFISNRNTCIGRTLSERSETIVTYALCGFANLSSIGVQLGGIGAMAPTRKKDLANIAIRALIAGTVTTLMTACIAGMLEVDVPTDNFVCMNATTAPTPKLDEQCLIDYCRVNYNITTVP